MRKLLTIMVLALASTLMGAQTTTVSLNVTDADNQAWANGTWSVVLAPSPGVVGGPYFILGSATPVPNQLQNGALDSNGNATVILTPNTSIAPSRSVWRFTVCSGTNPTVCSVSSQTVTGPTYSANLTPNGIRVQLANPVYNYSLYQDIEAVGPINGSLYWNLLSSIFRQFANGVWANFAGGGGALTGYTDAGTGPIGTAIATAGSTGAVSIPPTNSNATPWSNPNYRPIFDSRRLGDFRGGHLSLLDFGADPNGGYYPISTMSSGNSTFTINASGHWATPGLKPGARVCVSGAGVAGADNCGTVVNYSSGTVTMTSAASTSVTQRGSYWGNDNSVAIQAAISACTGSTISFPYGGCVIDVPAGVYLMGTSVNFPVIDGNFAGRIRFECHGRKQTWFVWTGADQGVMFSAPANSVPIEFDGCAFQSGDQFGGVYPGKGRAAIAIQFAGGTQHKFHDNFFGDLYEGIKGTSSWLNLVDFNYFFGPYHAAIHWYNGGVAPINATTVSNNEFGSYHLYGLLSESANSGGANGNTYVGNDWEGTSTDTIADVDMNDNWGYFGPNNRFETGGSSVVGYQQQILRGTYNQYWTTFCHAPITIAGSDNTMNCGTGFGMTTGDITDTGGFNLYKGGIPSIADIGGVGASSAVLMGGQRTGTYLSTGTIKLLAGGQADNTRGTAILALQSSQGGPLTAAAVEPTLSYNSLTPNAANGSTWQVGDFIRAVDIGYPPGAPKNNIFGWACGGGTNATCTLSGGVWGGTGTLRTIPSFTRWHGETTSSPTGLTFSTGDFSFNTSPTAGTTSLPTIVGWTNLSGGTPGTWLPVYAIDPANPPNWGATTQATGSFSGLSSTANIKTPTQITTPSLYAQYRADDVCPAVGNGNTLTAWNDSTGNAAHNLTTTSGTLPTCKQNALNGKWSTLWTGAGGNLNRAGLTKPTVPYVVCAVWKRTVGSGTALIAQVNGGGLLQVTDTQITMNVQPYAWTADNNWHVTCQNVLEAAGSTQYLDGTLKNTAGTSSYTFTTLFIGANVGANLTGELAEVDIWQGAALSSTDFSALSGYYYSFYNLPQSNAFPPLVVKNGGGTQVAGIDPNGKATTSGSSTGLTVVAFSATPIYDASVSNTFKITLTGNITSSTITNAIAGQPLTFEWCQDATGGRTNAMPPNLIGEGTPSQAPNACSAQSFIYDGANANATGPMIVYTNSGGSGVVARGTAALNTAAISSGVCDTTVTVAAPGVLTTDTIEFSPNTDPTAITGYAPSASGSLYIWKWPTANNVNFKVCNNTSGSITPSALTLNWVVSR